MYIHEQPDWPDFTWNQAALSSLLAEVRHSQGRLLGRKQQEAWKGICLRESVALAA